MSPRRTVEEALQTRASVLDAAFAAARRGAGRFTIDAVAREAGVTKGAVLHHFSSKEALAGAMLKRELDAFEAAIERNFAQEPEGMVGRWLRAYARASFEAGVPHAGVSEAVLAGVASDTGVLSSYEAPVCGLAREGDGERATKSQGQGRATGGGRGGYGGVVRPSASRGRRAGRVVAGASRPDSPGIAWARWVHPAAHPAAGRSRVVTGAGGYSRPCA